MPREIPDVPKDWKPPQPYSGHCYEIELITPMFGGGVETRVNDPSFPIRPTSIRGQLQFWWRATVGAQYANRQELRAAQSDVWGDTTQPSRVQVRVELLTADPPSPCARFERDQRDNSRFRSTPTWDMPFNNIDLPYALFPFQGQLADGRKGIQVKPASCIHRAKFRLILICDKSIDFAKQVEPALWAWVNFGGLGSRTRRGCGAIKCQQLLARDRNDLLARLKAYLFNASPKEWPTLAAACLVGPENSSPISAWGQVIQMMQKFRQGEGLGRNPRQQGSNRPGRSRWPEPETIRRITGRRAPFRLRQPHIPDDAFPRAELGLPIVFHFKDEQQGDPLDTVLYPDNDSEGKRRERMASPLILKPLALQSGRCVPVIVRLKTVELTGVDLRQGERSLPLPNPTRIRHPQLAQYTDSPMQNRSPNGSAIEAFLAYSREQGFTEVTR